MSFLYLPNGHYYYQKFGGGFEIDVLSIVCKLYFSPKDNSVIDMGWKISVLIFLLSQLFDLTYFDVRIGLLSWLLFAGLRNIIKENGQKFLTENN